ncbi:hypothetical protein [Bradyrhizobium sp. B117]|uniref:hypothetical protein n=1 Tax=Bradyrhizobium sp. B117 TaxID=3140246 RepID=UPI0031845774
MSAGDNARGLRGISPGSNIGIMGTSVYGGLIDSAPPGDSFWKMVDKADIKTRVYNKNASNEKKVDVAITTAMMDDAFNIIDKDNDDILLVASSEADERAAPDMSSTGRFC